MTIQVILGILWIFTQAVMGSLIQDPVVRRFNENNQSYVALGQRLHLQLPLEETDRFQLTFTDKTSTTRFILRYRKTQSNPPTSYNPRWQFVNENNTMILTSAERSDSGIYHLQIHDKTGTEKGRYSLQLNTEAQVSSVKVSYSCLSPGVMKVFCSADGDNLRFNWTSYSNPVTQLEDGNSAVILNKTQHGDVTCHVENHVSRAHNVAEVPPCPGFMVFVSVWLCEIIILMSLLVGAFYIYTRIHRKLRRTENQDVLQTRIRNTRSRSWCLFSI